MLKHNSSRSTKTSKINMSSMADVAFLVIIFFWVATSIPTQKGIPMTLPKGCVWVNEVYCGPKNIMRILLNSQNQVLIDGEEMPLLEVKERVIKYAIDTEELEGRKSRYAFISLRGDRGTNFTSYLLVLDQIKAAYASVRAKELGWSEEKMLHFLENKENATQEEIKKYNNVVFLYPEVISEAEPTEVEKP
jgi:biopolymer transport protein ExbD